MKLPISKVTKALGKERLTDDQLKFLKQRGFTPAKNSIGASFTRTETGKYAKESDIDKELESYKDASAVSMPSATGAGGSSELAVLKSIDKHLQQIIDAIQGNKQRQEAAAEESATENDAEKMTPEGEGEGSEAGGSSLATRNPVQILIALAIQTLVPIIKLIKSLYDEYLKPLIDKLVNVFNENIKPFFMETLPKFFTEDIPNFFTKTIPGLFRKGVDWFKDKLSAVKNMYDKVVGGIKERIGEIMQSIGNNAAVKFFLGEDNWFKTQGAKLSAEGVAQAKAGEMAESQRNTLTIVDESGKKVSVEKGQVISVNGKEITVPNSQSELDTLISGAKTGAAASPQPAEVSEGTRASAQSGYAVQSSSNQRMSSTGSTVAKSSATSMEPSAVTGDKSSSIPSDINTGEEVTSSSTSSAESMDSTSTSSGEMVAEASSTPMSSARTGVQVSAASMAVTAPEPVPGTPSFNNIKQRSATISNPHVQVNDNTSVPDVSPNLGMLAALLYFDASSNNRFSSGLSF